MQQEERWACMRLLTYFKTTAVMGRGGGNRPDSSQRLVESEVRKQRAGVQREQAFRASVGGHPLRAGSPALWPASELRLPQPASAGARLAAARPY